MRLPGFSSVSACKTFNVLRTLSGTKTSNGFIKERGSRGTLETPVICWNKGSGRGRKQTSSLSKRWKHSKENLHFCLYACGPTVPLSPGPPFTSKAGGVRRREARRRLGGAGAGAGVGIGFGPTQGAPTRPRPPPPGPCSGQAQNAHAPSLRSLHLLSTSSSGRRRVRYDPGYPSRSAHKWV